MKRFITTCAIALLGCMSILSCSSDNQTLDSNAVYIRLKNESNYTYENAKVDDHVSYGTINAHQITGYKRYETAYGYARIDVNIDGRHYLIQPIDFIGEELLENGMYTYWIDANSSSDPYGKLSMRLSRDK